MCFVFGRPRFEYRPGDQPSYLRLWWLSWAHLSPNNSTLRLPVTLFQIRHSQTPHHLMPWRSFQNFDLCGSCDQPLLGLEIISITMLTSSSSLRLPKAVTLIRFSNFVTHNFEFLTWSCQSWYNTTQKTAECKYLVRYGPRKGTTNTELIRPPTKFLNL
jgi:hypothetical protein